MQLVQDFYAAGAETTATTLGMGFVLYDKVSWCPDKSASKLHATYRNITLYGSQK